MHANKLQQRQVCEKTTTKQKKTIQKIYSTHTLIIKTQHKQNQHGQTSNVLQTQHKP